LGAVDNCTFHWSWNICCYWINRRGSCLKNERSRRSHFSWGSSDQPTTFGLLRLTLRTSHRPNFAFDQVLSELLSVFVTEDSRCDPAKQNPLRPSHKSHRTRVGTLGVDLSSILSANWNLRLIQSQRQRLKVSR
jgi:hypothetical protein